MAEVLLEALTDTLKMLPFLFGAYLLIEYLEHKASAKISGGLLKLGRFGPIGGAILGSVPQCGFSVAAANFFTERDITPGTLIAVFIATSDEAIPVLIANPSKVSYIWKLIVIKIIMAILAGIMVDILFNKLFSSKKDETLHKDCDAEDSGGIFRSALKHTLQIFIFLLLINIALSLMFYYIGNDNISKLFLNNSPFQPFVTALIGFIPNCAASVVLTELFINGNIALGSIVAGLSTGAGLGLAVLFKTNKNLKENLYILLILYLFSSLSGYIINLFV